MKRPSTKTLVSIALAVLLVAALAWASLWAKGVSDTANAGKAQAAAGARSLASMDTTAALLHFAEASASFASAERSLGPEWVARVVGAVPWVGHQFTTARDLSQIGGDASDAVIVLIGLLRSPAPTAGGAPAPGLIARLAARHVEAEQAIRSLMDAADRASRLSPDGLLPPLARAVVSAKSALAKAAPLVDRGRALVPLMSYLLSGERRLLVVSQNGAELRPTGGFAGTFGIIELGPTGVRLDKYRDVYVLPDPPGRVTPPAGALMTKDFGFRDANWWIDFPTSARSMLGFWSDYKQPPVDGLIAIDTVMMRELLEVTGPIDVPSIGETFTSENLHDRLMYLVELKPGTGKEVLVALAGELEKRVLDGDAAQTVKSSQALATAANAKHIQMYFVDPAAQAAVESLGWSGKVSAAGATDLLAVSNAMNMGGKVNVAMRKSMTYEVTLRPDRSADTTLVLTYANTGPYPMPLPSIFSDWLRVYRAPGVRFAATTPRGAQVATTTEFGLPAEVRTFTLRRGQSRTETLTSNVPGATAPQPDGGLRYRLRLIRQADVVDVPVTISVTVAPGLVVTGASARYTTSGDSVPVTRKGDTVRITVPLRGDLELDVRLGASR